MFPRAAAANRSIFYDRNGNARSASQVYGELTGRYATAAQSESTRSMMAAVGVVTPVTSTSSPAALSPATLAQAGSDPRTAFKTEMSEAESRQLGITERNSRFSFRTMFQTGDRAEAVSPAVRELWANGSSSSTAGIVSDVQKPSASSSSTQQTPQPLDLFSDRFGAFRS